MGQPITNCGLNNVITKLHLGKQTLSVWLRCAKCKYSHIKAVKSKPESVSNRTQLKFIRSVAQNLQHQRMHATKNPFKENMNPQIIIKFTTETVKSSYFSETIKNRKS